MGNHRLASAESRASDASQYAIEATASRSTGPRVLTLRDWPVSTRLIAVIILALLIGLVFGGREVASAVGSADEFGRVSQLAILGQQVSGLVQGLEDERDQTAGIAPITQASRQAAAAYATNDAAAVKVTNAAAARVLSLAGRIGGSFPANIQSRVATVVADIKDLQDLRTTAQASQSAVAVDGVYARPITDMIALDDQIGQGTSDAGLDNDVQTLNAMSLAKDQAAQQRGLLYNALFYHGFADEEQQALITAQSGQLIDLTAFSTTATPAEQGEYDSIVAGTQLNEEAETLEIYVQGASSLASGAAALGLSSAAAPATWYAAQSGTVDGMQRVELDVAGNIVARAQALQSGANNAALFTAIVSAIILLVVLLATVAVARSLVGPLRRLREGALNIATVELPERVRLLGEAQDPSTSLEVAPIDVLSADEIGQVARAFDQVHSEAVRLAGNEAMLRNSFNAMFVSLSRRSQSLIERLVRMIDSLEQNEGDPERLSSLFAMDHLVTRMRRNSENLLLLAGHERARKWSDPVSLADVARAAASEIEQYSRVTLKVQPGIAVTGPAVSDVVHLLAEVIENATIFSAKDTPVYVGAQELPSGGVLIEVSDSGVGIPEARLAEMNWRLDNPPVMDVSVSRHMGLFAVARLAERHGVRVRLRAGSPHGLTALVWLPDSITEREAGLYGARSRGFAAQSGFLGHRTAGMPVRPVPDAQLASHGREAVASGRLGISPGPAGPAVAPIAGGAAAPDWFRSRPLPAAGLAAQSAVQNDGRGSSGGASGASGASGPDWWTTGRHAAQIIAEPVRGELTAAGLPTRVPLANLVPGSAAAGRAVGGPGPARPGPGYDPPVPATPWSPRSPRSPEAARTRLRGFQSGGRRATDTENSAEGAE
jgi:signal transduction histidine kinase